MSSVDNLSTIGAMRREEEIRHADAWRRHHPVAIADDHATPRSWSGAIEEAGRRVTSVVLLTRRLIAVAHRPSRSGWRRGHG